MTLQFHLAMFLTNGIQWGDLTKFGADVIKEYNRLGILIHLFMQTMKWLVLRLKLQNIQLLFHIHDWIHN